MCVVCLYALECFCPSVCLCACVSDAGSSQNCPLPVVKRSWCVCVWWRDDLLFEAVTFEIICCVLHRCIQHNSPSPVPNSLHGNPNFLHPLILLWYPPAAGTQRI